MQYKIVGKHETQSLYPVKENVYRLSLAHIIEGGQKGVQHVSDNPARLAVNKNAFETLKVGDVITSLSVTWESATEVTDAA